MTFCLSARFPTALLIEAQEVGQDFSIDLRLPGGQRMLGRKWLAGADILPMPGNCGVLEAGKRRPSAQSPSLVFAFCSCPLH
jgi:hypothetical protein